ncbi:hypothetical protein U9M48_033640 [Paspalum notatum var. saurae]|uniref:Uncharacterized protein n=1 Tax=Paspalum notatum var. saurae TaxID=547442 RepID=A0AAQ3U8T7_PASNO
MAMSRPNSPVASRVTGSPPLARPAVMLALPRKVERRRPKCLACGRSSSDHHGFGSVSSARDQAPLHATVLVVSIPAAVGHCSFPVDPAAVRRTRAIPATVWEFLQPTSKPPVHAIRFSPEMQFFGGPLVIAESTARSGHGPTLGCLASQFLLPRWTRAAAMDSASPARRSPDSVEPNRQAANEPRRRETDGPAGAPDEHRAVGAVNTSRLPALVEINSKRKAQADDGWSSTKLVHCCREDSRHVPPPPSRMQQKMQYGQLAAAMSLKSQQSHAGAAESESWWTELSGGTRKTSINLTTLAAGWGSHRDARS